MRGGLQALISSYSHNHAHSRELSRFLRVRRLDVSRLRIGCRLLIITSWQLSPAEYKKCGSIFS